MKIALIPIDNRPVCYTLAKEIANIDEDLEFFIPERILLGGLKTTADTDGLINWLERLEEMDAIVISLDTIAYGGLIPSRRSKDSLSEIKTRLEKVKQLLKKGKKVYAFSSIMRISNNNINEEEKEYWNEYGTQIFDYSYNFHKNGEETGEIPTEILSDYLATRQRNFTINKLYLEWLDEGIFDTLVFSKDDCAEYGLNVLEADILKRTIKNKEFAEKNRSAFIKTGADEIPLTLFARAVSDFNKDEGKISPKIFAKFLAPEQDYLISKYEDISIFECANAQVELAGGETVTMEEDADICLIVNNFEEHQGEIVMGTKTKPFAGIFELPQKPFMIADVRFANGADNKFIEQFFKKLIKLKDCENFYGYSGWNTSANTLGSLICAAFVKFFAKKYNNEAFKKLQFIRLADDWAYQANVRQILKGKQEAGSKKPLPRPNIFKLKWFMRAYEKKLFKLLKVRFTTRYKFPWKRFFEVEVLIK